MTAALKGTLALSGDEFYALADLVGAPEAPSTIGLRSRHPQRDERDRARVEATHHLRSRGLLDGADVDDDVVWMLHGVQRPDRRLTVRLVTPDGHGYTAVIKTGRRGVLVRRFDRGVTLQVLDDITEVPAATVVAELPKGRPAGIEPVSAPVAELAEALSGNRDALDLADRIRALGAPPSASMLLGTALGAREGFAEIVHHSVGAGGEQLSRTDAAVAVFYTRRGRIVASPGRSPFGELWSTLTAGSDHAIAQAIGNLIDLSDEGW